LCGAGLFLSMLPHVLVYLRKYGMPPLAWFIFGVVAFAVLAMSEMQGIIRKSFGPFFLRVHIVSAYTALILVVLHWAWIYVV